MESSKVESLDSSSAEVKQLASDKKHSKAYIEGKKALIRLNNRLNI